MPAPSFTYTLTNGTTADASQVMQNFNDILNGVSDSTKDLSINALTVAGTATLNGAINLGNSSADDITVTGSLASTLPIKTTNSYDIGSSTLGLRVLYFGANSQTVGVKGSASMAATYTITWPVNVPSGSDYVLKSDASGVLSFTHPGPLGESGSDADTTLTLSSKRVQVVTPTVTTRVYTLPTTSVKAGDIWTFVNNAAVTSSVLYYTVKSSGGNTILTVLPQMTVQIVALQDTPTTAAHWMVLGSLVSNWFSWTPTFGTGFGTCTSISFQWRRNGGECEFRGTFITGTITTATVPSFTLPTTPALVIDTTFVTSDQVSVGTFSNITGMTSDFALQNAYGGIVYDSGAGNTKLLISRGNNGASAYGPGAAMNGYIGNTSTFDLRGRYPVSGWTSNSG